jgi:hypothetical protein
MWMVLRAKTAVAVVAVLLAGTGLAPAAASVRSAQAAAAIEGYTPAQLQSAYDLQSATSGMRRTVAVVDPDDDPDAASDLSAYRTEFGLPPCTTGNGCFTEVNEQGNASPLPDASLNWALSISISLDTISATCPNCRLLLVETDSEAMTDVGTGVNTAVGLHATVITTGVYESEIPADTGYDSEYFEHPGVAITAPAGDLGYGSIFYPAASPYVTAVGGTTLTPCTDARGWCETAYAGSSSGCSAYEPQPAWQAAAVTDTGCTTRVVADSAADADPATGVAVYDTYETPTLGWQPGPDNAGEGTTTVAAAIIAGTYALAGTPSPGTYPVSYLYQYPGGSAPAAAYPDAEGLNDITSGSNGTCTPTPLCTAGTGYDAPTGMGSPAYTTSFHGSGSQSGSVYSGVTGKCLDDADGSAADFNKVDITDCNADSAEQEWTIEADGTVQIDGACLDVYHSGTADATPIDLYACDGGGSQEWRPQADGSLVNPESGKCLADPSSASTDGTQLEIDTCNGIPGDQWALPYTVPTTTGAITSQLSASMCADDYHSGTANGNTIDLYACDGGSAQEWTIEPDGTVQVLGYCMATAADGTTDGTAVQLYACDGDPNQQWIARPDGSLLNRRSGTCLDDPGASLVSGTALVISSCNDSAEQSWILPSGVPGYEIASQASSADLSLSSSAGTMDQTTLAMAAGTSPAIAATPSGGWVAAFQASTTDLTIYTSAGVVDQTTLAMAADTSPAIAMLPSGSWVVAFQANTTDLYTYTSAGTATNTTLGMLARTSPAIAASASGSWVVAFQANTTDLVTYTSAGTFDKTTLGMLSGTSPAITSLTDGSWVVAFQANTADLYTYTSAGTATNTTLGMLAGTSPAIAGTLVGGWAIAYQANTNNLSVYTSAGALRSTTAQAMAPGTSPAITVLPYGEWVASYQASTNNLYTYTSAGTLTNTSRGMLGGTSPAITAPVF